MIHDYIIISLLTDTTVYILPIYGDRALVINEMLKVTSYPTHKFHKEITSEFVEETRIWFSVSSTHDSCSATCAIL